jgi:hypothetical protein
MKGIVSLSLMLIIFASCQTNHIIGTSDLNGTWLCYADFTAEEAGSNPIIMEFKTNGKYHITVIDNNTFTNKVSSGSYKLNRNLLEFDLKDSNDSIYLFPEMAFNNKPVKLVRHNTETGLQIKANNVWYYFEKLN